LTFIFNHSGVDFVEEHLLREVQAILEACNRRGIALFVIGAFAVGAYGSLLRRTLDLDLAVEREVWPALAEVLEGQGYRLAPAGIWVTATKGEGEGGVEIHIALGDVTDVHSALSYPVRVEPGTQRSLPDSNIVLPVFTLEGMLITKLIALRDNDVVDIVALMFRHADQIDAERFWNRAAAAGLESALEDRLAELEEMLRGGEVDAVWWDRLGLMLDESECQAALKVVRHLQDYAGYWTSAHRLNYMHSATLISITLPESVLIRRSLNRWQAAIASRWTCGSRNGLSVTTIRSCVA
jgi:hypothetical protein